MRISRLELLVVLCVVISAGYFNGGAAWNQNARLDAIYAFVEPGTADTGTFRIDRFLPNPKRAMNTGDWARVDDHYYANKAPGTILLGVAFYGPLYFLQTLVGTPVDDPFVQIFDAYLINLVVGVAWQGVAALAFFRMLVRDSTTTVATTLTLGLYLGTALFPFATQLWGHTTAAAFVVLGLHAARRETARSPAWAGFWLMAAVCTDYLCVVAAVCIGGALLVRRVRAIGWLLFGVAPVLALLLGYQWLCFGSPWTLATTYSNPQFIDQSRALGMFGVADSHAWLGLTFGLYRGVFVQTPVLLLALLGFYSWGRRAPRDVWLWACFASFVLALAVIASFNGWHAGASACARYMIAFLPLAFFATREIRWTRPLVVLAVALGALSVFNMLAVAAVNPLVPEEHTNPIYGFTYGSFFSGQLSPYPAGIRLQRFSPEWPELAQWSMWNWGELLGLRGLWSLLPLFCIWAALAVSTRRALIHER